MSTSDESVLQKHLVELPLDKTRPASGTHSLQPSAPDRGFRFSGSWSKVLRTQSAIASGDGVMWEMVLMWEDSGVKMISCRGASELQVAAGVTSVPSFIPLRPIALYPA